MINWWGLAHNALWIIGLAVGLAVVSVAGHEAQRGNQRLRDKLAEAGFQSTASVGLALFCAGLLFSAQSWWERGLWGVLALLFAAQAAWPWWQARAERRAAQRHTRRPRLARRTRFAGYTLILAGGLVLAAVLAITAVQGLDHARSLQGHLQALEAAAGGGVADLDAASVEDAGAHLAAMHDDLVALEGLAAPFLPLCRYLGWVPTYGGDLAAAPDLLDVAVGTSAAGNRVFRALLPAMDLFSDPDGELALSIEASARVLPVLAVARAEMEEAQSELSVVRQARERIDKERLSPHVGELLARLDRYLPWFETAVDGALVAPSLLGADGPRTYLVLAQNNHELRATGGFISGVGELTIDEGRPASLTFTDSYAVDNFSVPHEVPPADFQRVLMGEIWLFRDTNWDRDFPTSARRAMEVYARDRGVRADGVLALDLAALESLLGALGPVRVEDISEPVTARNVIEVLQAQWANPESGPGYEGVWDPEWWARRKDFMGQVANAALDKLLADQDVDPAALARALMQVLDEKHMLIYLADPAAARLLHDRHWDGALPEPFGLSDLLVVVDSNVGFNKVDPNIVRSIRYEVDLSAEKGPHATLTLTYHNRSQRPADACVQEARYGDAYADMMDRCYWDYVRVYALLGSNLLAAPALDLPPGSLLARSSEAPAESPLSRTLSEGIWTAWPAFFALAPGGEQTLTFEYQLPVTVLHADDAGLMHYRLRIPKQPGTDATPFELEVGLPPGAVLIDTVPADLFTPQDPFVSAATDLRTDREFEIVFRKDEN